jgi:hypothetical protein
MTLAPWPAATKQKPSNNQMSIWEFTTPRNTHFLAFKAQGHLLSTKGPREYSPAEKGKDAAQPQLAGYSLPRGGKPVEPSDHQICCDGLGAPARAAGGCCSDRAESPQIQESWRERLRQRRPPRSSTSVLVQAPPSSACCAVLCCVLCRVPAHPPGCTRNDAT